MFAVATAALVVAMATGVGAQLGVIDTSSVRWVHHGLFGASLATAVAALITTRRRSERTALLPAVAVLSTMPRTKGGSRAHGTTAGVAAACYAAGWAGRSWS
ncbi:MAG: hypothetical protein ACRDZ2_02200 [Ilumatobacteraceae bacterium]